MDEVVNGAVATMLERRSRNCCYQAIGLKTPVAGSMSAMGMLRQLAPSIYFKADESHT
jgi:hypothetical protein